MEVIFLQKNQNQEHLSYFNINFRKYINYIKIGTKKNWIEYGVYEREKQIGQLEELNSGNNIILNLKGLFYKSGIRNLRCDYIPHKYFFLIRTQIIFILKIILFKDKKFKNKYKDKKGLLFNYNIFILFIIFRKF